MPPLEISWHIVLNDPNIPVLLQVYPDPHHPCPRILKNNKKRQ